MLRVAHLSDVHLTAARSVRRAYGLRCRAVRFGRPSDPSLRAVRLRAALEAVVAAGADHLVLSGDLTELGDDAEFEMFAEVLSGAGIPESRITLVPGNHDAYTSSDGWRRALEGPLAPWAATSAPAGGVRIVDRGPLVLAAVDVSRHQPVVLSGGELSARLAEEIERRIAAPSRAGVAIALVVHHPPFPKHDNAAYRWVDSLQGSERLLALLGRHPTLYILHGHLHQAVDRLRTFGAPGVADDVEAPRVRLYDVTGGALVPSGVVTAAPAPASAGSGSDAGPMGRP